MSPRLPAFPPGVIVSVRATRRSGDHFGSVNKKVGEAM